MASSNDRSIAASSSFSSAVQTTELDAIIIAETTKISGLAGNSKTIAVSSRVAWLTSVQDEAAVCLFLLAARAFTTA